MSRIVAWFSCGVTSAVACQLAVKKYPNCKVIYCQTNSEHQDNKRFLNQFEKWLNVKVTCISSKKYTDIWEVFNKTRYLVGVGGARCTGELKKTPRLEYQQPDDLQVFGFDRDEVHRANRFNEHNLGIDTWFPLIEENVSKMDCISIVRNAGIEIPAMYKMGYRNNNCIGCVKGQSGYWNKIRKDFPDVFDRMAKVERELNVAICKSYAGDKKRKRVFLDELDKDAGRHEDLDISCGLFCGEY